MRLDPSLRDNLESADALIHQVDELARALRSYRDGIEYSPERLHELEERLDLINRLRRKYGSTIGEILAFSESAVGGAGNAGPQGGACGGIEGPGDGPSEASSADLPVSSPKPGNSQPAAWLTRYRKEAAGLGFGHAEVLVDIRQSDSEDGVPVGTPDSGTQPLLLEGSPSGASRSSETGIDSVEFLISLNPGEPPRPLARIASGRRGLEADARHKVHPVHS